MRLSLKAQANPWSSVPASIIEDAAVAGCASLRDQGDVVARIEDIHSTADIVSKNPDPTGQKPALTYDQAVALQMTMASVYCPELGVRS